jgi:hypothetical protein
VSLGELPRGHPPGFAAEHLDAGGNLVVAGPGARVSIGAQSATRIVPVPSEQAPSEYVDRPELTGPLLAHLLDVRPRPKGRAIISAVHGLGGIGKTTVARWLVWQPEIEQRFPDGRVWVTLGGDIDAPDAIAVITDCVGQLDPTFKTKATVEAARADLAALLQDRSVLFVLDDVWLGRSAKVAKALMVPSVRSRFLLTTRFPQLADDPEVKAEDFPLDEMNFDQSAKLIARALGRELSAAEKVHAERLCEIVGGHPLALELAAARIKDGKHWDTLLGDLSAEIARFEALEETDDDLVAAPIGVEARQRSKSVRASLLLSVRYLSRQGQRLFAWLGVTAEDATITPQMAATLWSTDEETAHRHLHTLSGFGLLSAKGDDYSTHDLMLDLARELLTAPETVARTGDIPGFGLTWREAHRQLLGTYRDKTKNGLWHTLPDDGYIYDHLVRHLEQAVWERELEGLLWDESEDRHCGWYQARERLEQTAGFLADVGRVWSYADRLGAVAASEEGRGHAIALQLHCALIAASINSLSGGLPTDVLVGAVRWGMLSPQSALALSRRHPEPGSRVLGLLALVNEMQPSLQPSVLGEALDAARKISYPVSRAWALAEVAQQLPDEEQSRVFGEALSGARSIDAAHSRGEALLEIAQRLPAGEALAVARSIDHEEYGAQAMAAVAQRLSAEEQPRVFREALITARGIDFLEWRARALAGVAQRLPSEQQYGVFQEALNAARGIIRGYWRDGALAQISLGLPMDEALALANTIDTPSARCEALLGIANRLPTEEALALVQRIDDVGLRAKAIASVSVRLPVPEALALARGVDNGWWRAWALAKIGVRVPTRDGSNVIREALSASRSINDGTSRFGALTKVAKWLPVEERPGMLCDGLSSARGIDDAMERANALAEIAQQLSGEEQTHVFREALGAVRGINFARGRWHQLLEIAHWLRQKSSPL